MCVSVNTPPVIIMATAGDSWYPALLGLADSFRQANNIKVRLGITVGRGITLSC